MTADYHFQWRKFMKITLITSIWVHISEVARYFLIVIPKIKLFWNDNEQVADMDWHIFGIWGLWDTLLAGLCVFMYWIVAQQFGNNLSSVFKSSFIAWLFFFVLFWVGAANMGLSHWSLLLYTLPLSFLEMFVAAFIASKLFR